MINHDLEISLNLAVSEAARRGHEYVTIEHVLYALLQNESATRAVRACGGSVDKTRLEIEEFFQEHLLSGILKAGQMPQPTVGFQRVIQRAAQQVRASGKERIKGENILVSIFSERDSFAVYLLQKQHISRFDIINYISHGIYKTGVDQIDEAKVDDLKTQKPVSDFDEEDSDPSNKSFLALYTVDLCARAVEGKIDPLIGRRNEVERLVQILCRRRKNNPLLVGDAGVGKTALVEGLALKITEKSVPDFLKDAKIYSLDMGTLLAGTKFRGDFEQRLKGIVGELKKKRHAILFIDEIHTVIGAGSVGGGTMDASNLLKPALSSGEIRCMGSTTFKEFRNFFENDHALSRRFQRVDIDEPSGDDTIEILKGLKSKYEQFHNIQLSVEAIKLAVDLSMRYLRDKKLPDKAIDVIDEVGAVYTLKGSKTSDKPKKVSLSDIETVVAKMAKVPLQKINQSQKDDIRNLEGRLKSVVFGQDSAIEALVSVIKVSKSGLGSIDRPIGSFLFAGPTGVGKTEVAKQLAETMAISFVRYDMSEYMEKHTVSRLIGAPPGYVGFDQGGLLTDSINKNPYSVVLFDEIEKAHPDMQNILLQVLDHGTLTDSNGRETDFRNTIIILTTNAGAREMTSGSIGFNRPIFTALEGENETLKITFSPEFRNRLDRVVTFNQLDTAMIAQVVDKFIKQLQLKLYAKKVVLTADDKARAWIAKTGYSAIYGARPIARLIQDKIANPIAEHILFGKLEKGGNCLVTNVEGEPELSFAFS